MIGFELQIESPVTREGVIRDLAASSETPLLVLNTCQRLECFGMAAPALESARVGRTWQDRAAFERLARIAAGLESRIVGELEVLGQVRDGYRHFRKRGHETRSLDRIFQEALALARKARKESGIDGNLTSLSGHAARELLARVPAGEPVAVVGAGVLAGSVARYLGKRGSSPVRVTSRCPDNALRLAMEVGGFGSGLESMAHLFAEVAGIITATSAPHPVVFAEHIEGAKRPLPIIDMGVPPDCDESVRALDDVHYVGLTEIEDRVQTHTEERLQRAEVAAGIIADGAEAWASRR